MNHIPLLADDEVGLVIDFRFQVGITHIFVGICTNGEMVDEFFTQIS